jgi:crotonobetainyl-CoA:carnitine CoA-transferase CaiB-like acyl-CoA transferase
VPERLTAEHYATRLLSELGQAAPGAGNDGRLAADHPALAWRRSGLMHLTGQPEGHALVCPAALASAADGALLALKALVVEPGRLPARGAPLLGERARLMGLRRQGRASPNGACRLIDTMDGRMALNLPRPDDWALLPALFEGQPAADWAAIRRLMAGCRTADILARAIELGLAAARDGPPGTVQRLFAPMPPAARPGRAPLVLDFSSLWAGPLAASLLGMAGAHVVKVESIGRPDGARGGNRRFYDLLNGGKHSVALDFGHRDGLSMLRALAATADIVVEASRPRALRRLGILREDVVARGGVWLSITGYPAQPDRAGFGDDAAVEAGLASVMAQGWGEPLMAGDAIADPLTGLHAALGGWAAWRGGGGQLVEVSLAGVVAHAIGAGCAGAGALPAWQALAEADTAPLYALRQPTASAPPLGADTRNVLAQC